MSIFRSIQLQYWIGALLIPGYLYGLGAEQRADGFFDRWFNLTLSFYFTEEVHQDIRKRIQEGGTVTEVIEMASVWAAHHQEPTTETKEQAHESLFSLLIGEWKQFRNLISAALTVIPPEYRALKPPASMPADLSGITFPNAVDLFIRYRSVRALLSPYTVEVLATPIPLISGMAPAAP